MNPTWHSSASQFSSVTIQVSSKANRTVTDRFAQHTRKPLVLRYMGFLLLLGLLLTASAAHAVNLRFFSQPGLSVSPTTVPWGGSVNLSLSVLNAANDTATNIQVRLYLEKPDGTNSTQFTYITFPNLGPLGSAGGTLAIGLPQFIPAGLASGPLALRATIYSGNTAYQSAVAGTLNVTTPSPDLVGYSFAVQQNAAVWGSSIGVQFEVANQTAGNAGPFKANVVLSRTGVFANNSPDCYVLSSVNFTNGLQGGYIGGWDSFTNVSLPSANPFLDSTTTFHLGLVIDPANQVAESNESNNANQGPGIDSASQAVIITVPQPSLLVAGSSPAGSNSTLAFNNVVVDGAGGAVGTQTVTLTDAGPAASNITGISVSGAPFQIASVVSSIQNLTQPLTYPRPLQSNGAENWVVTVNYDPTIVGTQTGTLTITSNDPSHPTATVSLSGTGVAIPRLAIADPVSPADDLLADFGGIVNDGTGGTASLLTFALTNTGSGALTVNQNGIGLTDTASGVWSIVSITSNTQGAINLATSPRTLAPNSTETWNVIVKFDPTANTNYVTGLQIASNDPTLPLATCTLKGAGLSPMTLTVTDSIGSPTDHAMDFGSAHATGRPQSAGTVTLVNTGQVPLTLPQDSIALLNGTNFAIAGIQSTAQGTINLAAGPGTIAASQTETWTVSLTFAPTVSGAISNQLSILSNDPAHGNIPVMLTGKGLNQPGITVADSSGASDDHSIDFGPVLNDGPGQHVATRTVTITNVGAQPVVIPAGGITTANSPGYSIQGIISSTQGTIDAAAGGSIAANQAETWAVALAFDPMANSSYLGNLTIQSNDPVSPTVTVALSGSGTEPSITLLPQTAAPTLYIPAGQIYTIRWKASDSASDAQVTLYRDTDTDPNTGLTQLVANVPYVRSSATTYSYDWRPDATLAGQEFTIYGTIQDGVISRGSYSAQKVHVEDSGAFSLLSPLETTNSVYAYQYIYNGKVYAGTATLQPGANVITIATPLPGGGSATHQITVNQVASLLATQGYTYDELGRVKTYTNGNGIVTTYTYDFAGNLTQTLASNGDKVSYTYDAVNRRTSMTDSTGTTFYDYDDLDRVTAITYSTDAVKGNADDLVLGYGYDNANRITSLTYPGGEQIAYTYDDAGRMLTANDVTAGQNTSYVYSPTTGLLQIVTRANGVVTTYGYDNMGRVNDIKHAKGAATLGEFAYTLNSLGNATAVLTTYPDGSQRQTLYAYDELNRLTQVVYGGSAVAGANDKTVSYTYDGVGNRLTQTTTANGAVTEALTYTYGSENRLLQINDQNGTTVATYTYDAAGNRVQMTTPNGDTFYTYDERNLLTSMLSPTDYINYVYNGDSLRVHETVNGKQTSYVIDTNRPVFQAIQERSQGAIVQSHIYGLGRLESISLSGNTAFYLQDRLESARVNVDFTGAILSTADFDAFGNTLTNGKFGFTSESQDRYLVYLRQRYYEPQTGRFLGKDALGIAGGLDAYVYCNNNPVNLQDPLGKKGVALSVVGSAGAGTAGSLTGTVGFSVDSSDPGDFTKWQIGYATAESIGPSVPLDPSASALLEVGQMKGNFSDLNGPTYGVTGSVGGPVPIGPVVVPAAASLSYSNVSIVDGVPDFSKSMVSAGIGFGTPGAQGSFSVSNTTTHVYTGMDFVNDVGPYVDKAANGIYAVADAAKYDYDFVASQVGSVFSDIGNQLSGLSFNIGGVLIDKAATLVGTNLSSIQGATYDPVTKQIVFLGSSNVVASTAIDMDYFYTAVQAVYGSATPPFVTLDPPTSMSTPWTDYGNGNGVFENGETNGFVLRYNPLWPGEDTTLDIRIRASWSGADYDFTMHFQAEELNGSPITIEGGGRYGMRWIYTGATDMPDGMTLDTRFFDNNYLPGSFVVNAAGQDSYWPVLLTNNTGGNMIVDSVSVIPARQHRKYGGRVDGTKLGWVMYEADRVMKCLSVGKDDLTGATYSSANVNVPGYQNLIERAQVSGSTGGNVRMWFVPNDMTLQRYVDPSTGRATIAFQNSTVALLTESYLQGLPQDPDASAFATHFQQHYDSFAALNFPVEDPTDPTGTRIINVPIFALLKQAMQAVSLARFFRDNGIPLDLWWLNSWQPPKAYSPKSIPTAYNEINNGSGWYLIYGGVQIQKPNSYVPSPTAQSIGEAIAAARPADPAKPTEDLPLQSWSAGTAAGQMNAVAASFTHDHQDGNVNLAHRDFSFASPGELRLGFTRYCQSSWLGTGNLGPGWRDTRYVLQFSNPSWYDQNHLMTDTAGHSIATDANFDTRLRSGTIRLVDLATGSLTDFQSSLSLSYGMNSLGNPTVLINGLNGSNLPTFTPGPHASGATLGQTTDGKFGYFVTLSDGSVLNFDSSGNLLMTTDRHNYSHSYTYDANGFLTKITDAAAQVISLAYNADSTLASATGPNGVGATYHYDASGRLISVVDNLSSAVLAQYTYNSENQLIDVTRLDGLKPVTTTADIKGRSGVRKNERGNTANVSYFKNAGTGAHVTVVQDPNSGLAPAQKGMDDSGRTTYTTDQLGNTTTYGYTGASLLPNQVQLPTPGRPAISVQRNSVGLPTTITDPGVPAALPTQITYGNANLPTQITDGGGRTAEYTYTGSNNLQRRRRMHNGAPVDVNFGYQNEFLKTVTDPLNHTWTLGRDSLGRITSVKDPTNVTVSYEYDTLGRLSKVHDPRLSSAVIYGYDSLNRVTNVTNPAGTTTYTYDPVTTWCTSSTTTTTDGLTRTVQFGHDNQTGDLTSTSYQVTQSGGSVSTLTNNYSYDSYGNLRSVTPASAAPINYNYNAVGQLLSTSETNVGLTAAPFPLTASNAASGVWSNSPNQTFVWGAPPSVVAISGYAYAEDAPTAMAVNNTTATVDWTNISEGRHTFRVRGHDTAGNWSPEALFQLWVDLTPPTISSFNLALSAQGDTATITTNIADALSGLASGSKPQLSWCASSDTTRNWSTNADMTFVNGQQWKGSVTANWPQYIGQTLYLRVQALDVAGNLATTITPCGVILPSANPTIAGVATGGGIFANGVNTSVNAAPNGGFVFANWMSSGATVSASPTYNFAVNGIQSLVANFQPVTFNAWKSTVFTPAQLNNPSISGSAANPAGDGVSNLVKYALGMDPNTSSRNGLPTMALTTINGTLYLSMTYTRNKGATDLGFHPEWSTSLFGWSSSGVIENVLVDGTFTQTIQNLVPVNSRSTLFLHLEIEQP